MPRIHQPRRRLNRSQPLKILTPGMTLRRVFLTRNFSPSEGVGSNTMRRSVRRRGHVRYRWSSRSNRFRNDLAICPHNAVPLPQTEVTRYDSSVSSGSTKVFIEKEARIGYCLFGCSRSLQYQRHVQRWCSWSGMGRSLESGVRWSQDCRRNHQRIL